MLAAELHNRTLRLQGGLGRRDTTYPFFVISSRFYEKNLRLAAELPVYDALITPALERFGYGYLPSYDRDTLFEDLRDYFRLGRLGMIEAGISFAHDLFGVRPSVDYRFISDFFCNYIGFRDRAAFDAYFATMRMALDAFVGPDMEIIRSYEGIVRRRNVFRNEKPLTLFLEMCSHMHFYREQARFAGLKYDGLYDVDERSASASLIVA